MSERLERKYLKPATTYAATSQLIAYRDGDVTAARLLPGTGVNRPLGWVHAQQMDETALASLGAPNGFYGNLSAFWHDYIRKDVLGKLKAPAVEMHVATGDEARRVGLDETLLRVALEIVGSEHVVLNAPPASGEDLRFVLGRHGFKPIGASRYVGVVRNSAHASDWKPCMYAAPEHLLLENLLALELDRLETFNPTWAPGIARQ